MTLGTLELGGLDSGLTINLSDKKDKKTSRHCIALQWHPIVKSKAPSNPGWPDILIHCDSSFRCTTNKHK